MSKLVLLLFLVSLNYAFSIESSYDIAHKKAIAEGKILMVFLTKKRSHYSNTQLLKILNDKKISKRVEEKAVFVFVYKEQDESYPIELLYTLEYPTLFFLNSNELFECEAIRGEIKKESIYRCID